MKLKVGIEIGGTFTDLLLINENGEVVNSLKVHSTPKNPEQAVFTALSKLNLGSEEIETFIHGSTVATNTVLERKGALTALLVTKGFKDILEIQRHDRRNIYDIFCQKPAPLIPRDLVLEVDERILADGTIDKNLEQKEVVDLINQLKDKGVVSIAVCLLNSYANPIHEEAIRNIINDYAPETYLTLSHDILPEFREYERASTTSLSAYVRPNIERYIKRIEDRLGELNIDEMWIVQSNGGILPGELARQHAVRTLVSGPAAGVTAAVQVAQQAGYKNIITVDMGGTSTDVCLITDGNPEITNNGNIDFLPLKVPMFDIVTVGAGGGSIAQLDAGNMLKVGPESAGADPGPVCYDKGGKLPTITDANLELGLIRPDKFLGGNELLNKEATHNAFSGLSKDMGMEPAQVANGIFKIANANMSRAISLVSTERGYDPREYTIVAFGGAGPLHAACLAQELEIPRVLIPNYAGVLSAYGLLVANFRRDFVQTKIQPVKETAVENIVSTFDLLGENAKSELLKYGHAMKFEDAVLTYQLDVRYIGQAYERTITLDMESLKAGNLNQISELFNAEHLQKYGHCSPDEPCEIVNYRLTLQIEQKAPVNTTPEVKAKLEPDKQPIFIDEKSECSFFKRQELPIGFSSHGPMVIEDNTSTTFVPSDWNANIDEFGNIILTRRLK